MKWLKVIFAVTILIGVDVTSSSIEYDVMKYFQSATTKDFHKQWEKYRASFENAIRLALKDTYGQRNMNIYKKRAADDQQMAKGFFLSDDVVQLLLLNLTLRDLPLLIAPEVKFQLDKNVLTVEGGLTNMFVDADYLLFRNHSNIMYDQGANQDPYRESPFTFQQVQTVGKVVIIVEDCNLISRSVTTLIGQTVNVGHSLFKMVDCTFSVEIYTPGRGSPPVIAPYFSKEQRVLLKRLLATPIVNEITTRLQGALFSLVNTTTVFNKDLMKFRHHQEKLFKKTSDYMTKGVRNMNKITSQQNHGRLDLEDFELYWDEKLEVLGDETDIRLTNMAIYGLGTAYSANRGGPYEMTNSMMLGDIISFHTLHLQGKMHFEKGDVKGIHDFAVELHDVSVAVAIRIKIADAKMQMEPTADVTQFEVRDWRIMDYSIMHLDLFIKERITSHALVTGYLINQIPKKLIGCLAPLFSKAFLTDLRPKQSDEIIDKDDDDNNADDNYNPDKDYANDSVNNNEDEGNDSKRDDDKSNKSVNNDHGKSNDNKINDNNTLVDNDESKSNDNNVNKGNANDSNDNGEDEGIVVYSGEKDKKPNEVQGEVEGEMGRDYHVDNIKKHRLENVKLKIVSAAPKQILQDVSI